MIGELGSGSIAVDSTMAVHILAGIGALLAGLGAIATRKGGTRHNRFGRAYALSMGIVVVTAAPLAIWADNWFLLAIAVFSGYLVFAGYRAVQRRRAGLTAPVALDVAGHGTMVAVGGGMVVAGIWQSVTGPVGLAPALATFGGIGAGFAAFTLVQFRSSPAKRPPWIQKHVAFMGGAYIATVTAVITVNLSTVPPLIRWLGPTIVGTPLVVYAIRTYTPRFAPTG
ncbi:hypothetical protein [Natrarchaeobius chitinivorans]|uniref:DUF2306 domain-containing protein n=1 Tax=Natrarchaeobius chitinivorans TaxID=1679083 RepID=A0A3N6P3Q5_NATCH|nr:hypothetical protein [Natrarchaeobius chitinivorans]RQG92399.1 hypothetical protein EA473_16625 [Natrarchaeobius chitinivorans]